jgi:hypothetical protein
MTIDEWATVYILRFGARQICELGVCEGEGEFVEAFERNVRCKLPYSTLRDAIVERYPHLAGR